MNAKTANQIAEMKKQTIGVEVEMNSITRERAARIAATFFETGRYAYTADRNSYCTWSAWDRQGREWKFQRDSSIEGPERKAMPHDAAESTSTSVRKDTLPKPSATWQTLWQATKTSSLPPFTSMPTGSTTTAKRLSLASWRRSTEPNPTRWQGWRTFGIRATMPPTAEATTTTEADTIC